MRVRLQPIVSEINLPTVLKTAILPGETTERLFIATQVGEIFYIKNGEVRTFLDIRSRIIELGTNGGYDERGLLGLAFHPYFHYNGLFYLHYSVAGTQGPGAPADPFEPDPCDPRTLQLKWTNRNTQYDHIDTVEEWMLLPNGEVEKRRTLLNLKRPFMNHNGVNSLNFSPETGKLILTTGDGGSGFDPYNLSQDDMEICGKIIEIDVQQDTGIDQPPAATRFNELPHAIQQTLTVMAKGVRNMPGITFQRLYNQYIKYVGQVGQELVESIYSFTQYKPIPVTQLVQSYLKRIPLNQEGIINLGWRGWEGILPTPVIQTCSNNSDVDQKVIAFYDETVTLSARHHLPLTSYFHQDPRPNKFQATALTGVQVYMGNALPHLTGSVIFTDFAKRTDSQAPTRGALSYTRLRSDRKLSDFHEIKIDDPFGSQSAYYVSLGTNLNQSRLYLGVYGSSAVTDLHQGAVYEIVL